MIVGAMERTAICACATALPAHSALIRLSGPGAPAIAHRAGLTVPAAWSWSASSWTLDPGSFPVRALFAPAGRSFTGEDLVEITLPGAPDLVALALAALGAAGAQA
ncbi:MAG: hypothetical protein H0W72_18040, partial [Planctomycetes bacterium]|nr:hypothetical protein [Planctomycetota bacterium]